MNNAIRGAATVLAMSPELIRQAEFTLARRMGRIPPRRRPTVEIPARW